jgi:hypothetical protein
LGTGDYSFLVHYDGDTNYAADDAPCEWVHVNQGTLTIETEVHDPNHTDVTNKIVAAGTPVHDKLIVSGATSGFPIEGTATFKLYSGACTSGTLLTTESGVSVGANGIAESLDSSSSLQPGYYCYKVTFTDTTGEYHNGTADDEPFQIIQKSVVTNTELCTFDVDPNADGDNLRLIFTPDQSASIWKLNASNPGQFYYNVFDNDPTGKIYFTVPYPWVTTGAQPVHAYGDVETYTDPNGETCLIPSNGIGQGSDDVYGITLGSYSDTNGDGHVGFGDVYNVPVFEFTSSTGFAYVNIHLDYGLKKTTGYSKNAYDDAVDAIDTSKVLIPNGESYTFKVKNGIVDEATVSSLNTFKRDPGVAGMVTEVGSGDPIAGTRVKITLYAQKGIKSVTVTTDGDGWYMWQYKYTGKPAEFTVQLLDHPSVAAKSDVLKGNGFVVIDFEI